MRIIVAPASFKGSLSAFGAASAIAEGLKRARPAWEAVPMPVADGGEGMVDCLASALGAEKKRVKCEGPLGGEVEATFMVRGAFAAIEMAASCGLTLVPEGSRDPKATTTRGLGRQISAALDLGVAEILLGIGGSATNDGGAGMAQALGYRLFDSYGADLPPGGAALLHLAGIDASRRDRRLARTVFRVACDVSNPMLGPDGASFTFGPQKGASTGDCVLLDRALGKLAEIVERDLGVRIKDIPGGGAAGGLGAGAVAFLGASLLPGIDVILEAIGFRSAIRGADAVVTGEGRLDAQTSRGKAPFGVAKACRKAGIPCLAVAGSVERSPDAGDGPFEGCVSLAETFPELSTAELMSGARDCLRRIGARLAAMIEAVS